MFSPSLHKQRHEFVVDVVRKSKPKKVADLGCGECKLLKQLKFQRSIELLVGVDVNGAKMKKNMHGLAPLSTDYLQPSYEQLHVELYQGSVTQRDARLKGFDLVTSIELIEHLTLADVEHFSSVVFGYMSPASVIVSTPNSEFNTLLPGLIGFRHSDHKFEWNRSEFRSWAHKVCLDYGYEVEFTGVGEAPKELQESVGFCSQIGVFHRLEGSNHWREVEEVFPYTLVYSINYPSLNDSKILCRILVSEVLYWAEQMKNRWMEEKSGRKDGVLPHHQAGQGGLEKLPSDLQSQTGESEEPECGELLWTNDSPQEESGTLNRYITVPLAVLWSRCPKITELSGSLGKLRHLLMDQPLVKLTQDGSSLLLQCEEQDPFQVKSELENDEDRLAVQCSYRAEPNEDWEANI